MNDLEFELVETTRLLNKDQYEIQLIKENIRKLELKREEILVKMSNISVEELTTVEIINLGKLLQHIVTIINTDEVIGWTISLLNKDPTYEVDYDRGKYSIKITNYTIDEYGHIGLRYDFQFNTKHPMVKEIICKVFDELPKVLSTNEIAWSMFLYGPNLTQKHRLKINEDYLKSLL